MSDPLGSPNGDSHPPQSKPTSVIQSSPRQSSVIMTPVQQSPPPAVQKPPALPPQQSPVLHSTIVQHTKPTTSPPKPAAPPGPQPATASQPSQPAVKPQALIQSAKPAEPTPPKPVQAIPPKPVQATPPKPVQATPPKPVQAIPSKPVQAIPPKPVQATPPKPVQATPPKPVQSAPPKPVQATPPKPVQAIPPKPVQATPPKPVQGTPPKPVQATPPKPVQGTPPKPVQQTPPKPVQATPPKSFQNPVLQSMAAAATLTPKTVKEPDFWPKSSSTSSVEKTPAKPVLPGGVTMTPVSASPKPQPAGLVITPVASTPKPAVKPALTISNVAGESTLTKPPFVDETAVTSEKEWVSRPGLEITPLKVDHGLKMTISASKKRIITAPPTRVVNKVMAPGAKKVVEEIEIDDDDDEEDEDDDEDDDDDDDDDDEEDESEEEEEEEGSKEEDDDQSVEEIDVEPPQKTVRRGKTSNSSRMSDVSVKITKINVNATPKRKAAALDLLDSSKKRGRPTRAALEERERERQEAIARGEPDPELKRKRRKPNKLKDAASSEEDPDSQNPVKKISKKEEKEIKKKEKFEKKQKEKDDKPEVKRRRKKKQASQSDTDDDKPRKKPGRQKKILTEDELAARDAERKAKYAAIRDKQKEKKAKREAYLIRKRDERKAQKEEEKKRQAEHDKRMAELKAQYLDDSMSAMDMLGPGSPFVDENSQSSIGSAADFKKKKGWAQVGSQEMVGIHNPLAHVTAETLFEYKWPMEGRNSEHYFLQEQVTEYLGVKSFKRRYPDCPRRMIGSDERDVLMEMKIVNETQADLGLTAIPSSSVLDIMCADFYEKYESYMNVVNERKEKSFKFQSYTSSASGVNIQDAVKAAAEWNKQLNHVRKTERAAAFDLQTMTVHYPKTGKGKMKVLPKRSLGNYPIALIPGQFVDSFKEYSSKQLRYLPVNTVLEPPPQPGKTFKDLLGSEGGSGESSSDSESDSSSDSDDSEAAAPVRVMRRGRRSTVVETNLSPMKKAAEMKKEKEQREEEMAKELAAKEEALKKEEEAKLLAQKPKRPIDEVRPGAICRTCQGNALQNKFGTPELLLHCSKCESSNHPTCAGLHLDLLSYVTNYSWECMECKKCMTCQDPKDEDKMLFCDLCDRGYHTDCVGLAEVPSGRWHCGDCATCVSCSSKNSFGDQEDEYGSLPWVFETKQGLKGDKVYSHTMCQPCHKIWKKGLYCPECNGVFGRSKYTMTAKCWVCFREHHAACVGQDKPTAMFICGACQRRTQEKTISSGVAGTPMQNKGGVSAFSRTPAQSFSRPPPQAFSRSGRRVAPMNYQQYQ